jgi:hypothetical protein
VQAPPGASPPDLGSQTQLDTFDRCATAAREFLGDDWSAAVAGISVTFPRDEDWAAGSRFYSCEVFEARAIGDRTGKTRTGSMRDGLRGDRPLALRCLTGTDLTPVGCDQPHTAEFTGTFVVARGAALPPRLAAVAPDRCQTIVTGFVGAASRHVQVTYTGFNPVDWDLGINTVRCYASAPTGKRLIGSVKGLGTKAPRFG